MADLRPPYRLEMTEGETNTVEFDLAPALGSNVLTAITWEASGLTFADIAFDDDSTSATVSGGTAGTDYTVTITATFSNGDTKVYGPIIEWKSPGYEYRTGRR